ncbi:MAG TPA: hypothetical protein VL175_11435 [Pirellulales bacterium]|jgi:hypothetical protein|nr:hypothetical protein [Pirellulales bacterium]
MSDRDRLANEFAERLELFFGDASDAQARVYAQFQTSEREGLTLAGRLRGPTCAYADTLQTTLQFVDRGPGPSLLAEAYLLEPSYWTPDFPHLYRAELELRRGSEVIARTERPFGLRPLGAIGRKLVLDSRRWVLRGLLADETQNTDLPSWRASSMAMVVHNPSDELCDEASRLGVLLVAELAAEHTNEIERLSRWAAVGMIILPQGAAGPRERRTTNLILAERFDGMGPLSPRPWAQAVIGEVNDVETFAAHVSDCSLAVIACRAAGPLRSVSHGRAFCDALQSDLAGRAELAGYIV